MSYLYVIDMSGKCTEFYRKRSADDIWSKLVVGHIEKKKPFAQGDAMIVKTELYEAGFQWGKDFYLSKETPHA